jgi:tight adherence protein C
MIVCVEAGCGLDQAILKTSVELEISHPDSRRNCGSSRRRCARQDRAGGVQELRGADTRGRRARPGRDAGADDRFGTSIAQALRTHAETSAPSVASGPKRRPPRSASSSCFPLVFFLFPAFYVVTLGPAVIQFVRVFFGQVVNR